MKKNMKVIGYGLWVMVALLVSAPITAQNFGTEQPNANFRSTSTMVGSGSALSSHPTLNADGTASYESASMGTRKPRKDPSTPGSPTTPGQGEQQNQFPMGDAALPLALLACAYVLFRYVRTRKRA